MTEHFSLREFIRSDRGEAKGLDNNPPVDILPTINQTMAGMERIRSILGYPIKVLSGYRSPQVNALVGGQIDSQHIKGEACDFICNAFGSPLEIALRLEPLVRPLGIDQMILEGTWLHVSFTNKPRYAIYTFQDGKYKSGIVS